MPEIDWQGSLGTGHVLEENVGGGRSKAVLVFAVSCLEDR